MVMRLGLTIREGEPMPSGPAAFACCDRCANLAGDSTAGAQRGHLTAGAGATAATATVARRRILKAAVVRPQLAIDRTIQHDSRQPTETTMGNDEKRSGEDRRAKKEGHRWVIKSFLYSL